MNTLLVNCATIFDKATIPFGIVRVVVDNEGNPTDMVYEYLNPTMASMTRQTPESLIGKAVYEMWGGDRTWLNYFYRSAYLGESCEFEAVSTLMEEFESVISFPIKRGYCGFVCQHVMSWMGLVPLALENASAGLFFCDMRMNLLLLTSSARECCGLDQSYMSIDEFSDFVFGEGSSDRLREKIAELGLVHDRILYEEQALNGNWLRLSMAHTGDSDRFVYGFLEDFSRTKEAEEDSLRKKAALQEALNAAQHASSAKSAFLTNISHDFRTPMNAITGFATIALENLDDTDRVRDCLSKIKLSGEHLLNLVNDILDVSRIESGKMALNEEPMDLMDMAEGMLTMFSEQAERLGVDFSVDISGVQNAKVVTDPLRLNQMIVNLIGNALKFTPAQGKVLFRVTEKEQKQSLFDYFTFTVDDTGCGMTDEFMEKLFDPYERDDQEEVGHTEGTGLGMAIVKNIVELLNGTISVESEVGKGSRFTVVLPLRLNKEDTVKPSVASTQNTDEDHRRDAFSGSRALVVDDDELSREVMIEILKSRGFDVEDACDGDEAVEKMVASETGYYDVVIMDMRMSRMNGDEAARKIRTLKREDADVPIIAATADAFEEGYRRAFEAGMNAHITKPINLTELFGVLESCLSSG